MRQRLIIHIGLHKTGTTFYQRSVWPRWEAVAYAGKPRPKGASSLEAVIRGMDAPVILLSDETLCGSLKRSYLEAHTWPALLLGELEQLRHRYANDYDLGVVISLRRHDAWILSIYKHYLKYGGVESLESFLGLDATPATIPLSDMSFMDRVQRVQDILGVRPFCFFLEETRRQPQRLSMQLARFAGVDAGPQFTQDRLYNEGVNQREASLCRGLNRAIVNPGRRGKGSLERNATRGFSVARRLREMHLLGRGSGELSLPDAAVRKIRAACEPDLAASVGYLCDQRGLEAEAFRRELDLFL
jgi:hypothetical protein